MFVVVRPGVGNDAVDEPVRGLVFTVEEGRVAVDVGRTQEAVHIGVGVRKAHADLGRIAWLGFKTKRKAGRIGAVATSRRGVVKISRADHALHPQASAGGAVTGSHALRAAQTRADDAEDLIRCIGLNLNDHRRNFRRHGRHSIQRSLLESRIRGLEIISGGRCNGSKGLIAAGCSHERADGGSLIAVGSSALSNVTCILERDVEGALVFSISRNVENGVVVEFKGSISSDSAFLNQLI